MTDAERLHNAIQRAALVLATEVGIPIDPLKEGPSIHEFEPELRESVRVDRERVPEISWRGAVMALDFLLIAQGLGNMMAPGSVESLEDEAAALLRRRKP